MKSNKKETLRKIQEIEESGIIFKSFFKREFKRHITRVEKFIYKRAFSTGWNRGNIYKEEILRKEIEELKKEIDNLK